MSVNINQPNGRMFLHLETIDVSADRIFYPLNELGAYENKSIHDKPPDGSVFTTLSTTASTSLCRTSFADDRRVKSTPQVGRLTSHI